jgi:hypothetical protein
VKLDGKEWDALELKEKLVRDGYVVIDGKWMKKKDKMLSIPGLFRYEKQEKKQLVITGDLPMASNFVMNYKAVYNASSQQFTEEKSKTFTHRLYSPELNIETVEKRRDSGVEKETIWYEDEGKPEAGTKMAGELRIPILSDEPVLAARVIAYAEIDEGSVTCFVESQSGRTEAYKVTKTDTKSHNLPDAAVKNLTKFDVVFRVETAAAYVAKEEKRTLAALKKTKDNKVIQKEIEVRHKKLTLDYKTRLFASNSNQVEVFRATLTVAEPAPNLTKAFEDAGCADLLK